MKLIFCKNCQDVVKLQKEKRYCKCRKCYGRYVDDVKAEISESAIPIGIANTSFLKALRDGSGKMFDAFVIPLDSNTITVVGDLDD